MGNCTRLEGALRKREELDLLWVLYEHFQKQISTRPGDFFHFLSKMVSVSQVGFGRLGSVVEGISEGSAGLRAVC
jgi:hypothetical protein